MPGAFTNHSAQQVIDAEINRLLANVQELRFLRNTHSAIHKLPIDIISLILLEAKRTDFYSRKQTWKGLLGVCRRWRDILLALPAFWSMVDIPNECCPLQEVIQRSKRYPLSVVATLDESTEKLLNVMLGQSDRFKEFSVTFLRTASLDALSKIKITNPPPLLETLTLKAPYDWNFILPCPLPFTAGSLTVLRLDNIFFKPEIPVLISLRKLIIAGSWTEEELSIDWVAHLLRRTPNIEEVRIWGISDESKDIIVQHEPIYLQSLKVLSIASQLLSAEDIFDIIRFPASTIVTALYMGYFDDSSLQQLRIQDLLSSFTSCPDSVSFEKMRIILVDDEITEPGWSFHLEFFSADAEKPEPFLSHGIPFDSDMPGAYLDICTRLPLSQITELVLSQFYPSQEWQELFFGLVNLVVLSLEDLGDSWLTHLLADATTVPQLKVVSFRFMKLRSSAEKHTQTISPPALMNNKTSFGNDEDSSSTTLQFIKRRREAGVPLQKLILQECNITHKQVERLRPYVDVEWDGIEQVEDIDGRCPGPFSRKFLERYSNGLSDFDEDDVN